HHPAPRLRPGPRAGPTSTRGGGTASTLPHRPIRLTMCKRQPGLAMALVDDVGEVRHLTAKHSEGSLSLGQPASLVTRRLPATLKVVVPAPQLVAAGEKPGQLWLRGRNRSAPSSTCPTLTPTAARVAVLV